MTPSTAIEDYNFLAPNTANFLYGLIESAYKELSSKILHTCPLDSLNRCSNLADVIHLPILEAATLSVLVIKYESNHMIKEQEVLGFLSNIIDLKKCDLRNAIRNLKKIGLVGSFKDESIVFCYPKRNVIEAIDNDTLSFFQELKPKGLERMLDRWTSSVLDTMQLSPEEMRTIIEDCLSNNPELTLVKYLKDIPSHRGNLEAACILSICSKGLFYGRPFNFESFERRSHFTRFQMALFRESISEGTWKPIKEGYIQISGSRYTQDETNLELTEKGYTYFLKEIDPKQLKIMSKKTAHVSVPLINPKDIPKANLYFNESLQEQLRRIEMIFSKSQFNAYQRRYAKHSRMHGITCLFYGAPGCGKTEFALQLAKKTKRPIIKIQVTDFLSKWVGESESKLKRIFTEYRLLSEKSSNTPILLLNECDQMIGKRVNTSDSLDQMSNALQNILLEEMETFPGILIGTTNLINNMDSAFERRWLMKTEFIKADRITQQKIWQSFIPKLDIKKVKLLSEQFDLTPAEIHNISKRYEIENMLFPANTTDHKRLVEITMGERFQNKSNKKIGFTQQLKH